jgi:hypothetical protein
MTNCLNKKSFFSFKNIFQSEFFSKGRKQQQLRDVNKKGIKNKSSEL